MNPYGETITILRAQPGTNGYGDPLPADWSGDVAETVVTGCCVWARGSSEDNDGRTSVTVGIQITMPAGTDIAASDRLSWRGDIYEVEGQPFAWRNPLTGSAPGVELSAKVVTG